MSDWWPCVCVSILHKISHTYTFPRSAPRLGRMPGSKDECFQTSLSPHLPPLWSLSWLQTHMIMMIGSGNIFWSHPPRDNALLCLEKSSCPRGELLSWWESKQNWNWRETCLASSVPSLSSPTLARLSDLTSAMLMMMYSPRNCLILEYFNINSTNRKFHYHHRY